MDPFTIGFALTLLVVGVTSGKRKEYSDSSNTGYSDTTTIDENGNPVRTVTDDNGGIQITYYD